MTLVLRDELMSAAAEATPSGDLIARSRLAGQRRLRVRRRRAVLGAGVGLALVAVTAGLLPRTWSQQTPPASDGAAQFDSRVDDLTLYADSLRQSGDANVWAAREYLVGLCLQAKGITYKASPYPGGPAARTRYTYPAMDVVGRVGYDAPGLATADYGSGAASPDPSNGPVTNIPESQLQVRDTCNQQAIVWLEQKPVNDLRDAFDQENQTLANAALASPAYTTALSSWSTCMSNAGHPFSSPALARAYADSVRGTASQPSQVAIDVAVADYTCEHQARLLEVLHDEMATAVAGWVSGHAQELAQYESAVRVMDNKARTYGG